MGCPPIDAVLTEDGDASFSALIQEFLSYPQWYWFDRGFPFSVAAMFFINNDTA